MLSAWSRAWQRSRGAEAVEPPARPVSRRVLAWEVWVVLGLSLGQSGVYALVSFLAALTAPKALASQQAVLNGSAAPGRPWLDLTYQLLGVGFGLMPVVLVGYLLLRSGESLGVLGVDRRRLGFDLSSGGRACGLRRQHRPGLLPGHARRWAST